VYKISNMTILVTRPSMPRFEEYVAEIRDLWDNRWLTNNGVKLQKLEAELSQYLNVPNLALFVNGHLALENAIAVLGLKGEVITTPFTFASTTHAVVRNGLEPIFCDINPDDYTIDAEKIEQLITERTSAIIPVHVYGAVCDVEAIYKIAEKYNLKVIYDAAHAFGVTLNGNGIGNYGDVSMFSFHATKVFNTIEGGTLTFKDPALQRKLKCLVNFGMTGPETVEYISGNAKMNEFQAAMGLCNLRHIDEEINKRHKVVSRYLINLDGVEGIKILQSQPAVKSNFAYFPVVFDGYRKTRNEIYEALQNNNIHAKKYFYPLTSDFTCYKDSFLSSNTPVAQYISKRILALPLYADLSLEDVDKVCKVIKQ
jgi:dTDP-4-amino-4,6-dideoxygalactose transaminase